MSVATEKTVSEGKKRTGVDAMVLSDKGRRQGLSGSSRRRQILIILVVVKGALPAYIARCKPSELLAEFRRGVDRFRHADLSAVFSARTLINASSGT